MWPRKSKDADRKDDTTMTFGRRSLRTRKIKRLRVKANHLRLCDEARNEEMKIFQYEISKAFTRRRRLFLVESAQNIM